MAKRISLTGKLEQGTLRVAFVYPRSGPHKVLATYAKALNATHVWVDHALYAPENSSRIRRLLSAFWSAVTFPKLRTYDILLVSSPQVMPIFLRRLGLLRRGQRMVMYHNGETLYYLKTGYYGRVSKWLLSLSFKSFHANIVLGDMGVELYQALFGNEGPPCYKSFTGTPAETLNRFGQVQPALNSRSLLFIGQGPSGFRSHYKGLDILLESFERIGSTCAEAQLYIIGEWDEAVKQHLLSAHCPRTASRVFFLGAMKQEDMLNWMSSSAVYLHPARGEAFGTVVTDAMAAGLVPVVSEWTGAKEAVLQVDASLVVPLTPQAMAERVLQLFDAPVSELEGLSTRARKVGSQYTLENGLDKFLNTFHNILRSFDQN